MKEHPIIFSAEMVRAILDGRKTQTRRVIKPQPEKDPSGTKYNKSGYWCAIPGVGAMTPLHYLKHLCPYGKVGDVLWVRETFSACKKHVCGFDSKWDREKAVIYKADSFQKDPETYGGYGWRPSIHMPKWAARIWLEITNIRVERVQDIDNDWEDCLREGIDAPDISEAHGVHYKALLMFKALWNSLNTKRGYGWDKNPWVWVIEFKRIEHNA